MRKIELGLALVAALVFGVAMTASASASSFLSSVTKAKLLSENVATQVFTTEEGTVECTEVPIEKGETGTAGAEESSLLVSIKFKVTKCIAFGVVATIITEFHYLYLANNELADLNNLVKIVANTPFGTCEVSIKGKQKLKAVKYSTNGNNIKLEPNVTGITYTAGSGCQKPGTFTNGKYTGNFELMISGGSLSFMP